MHIRTPGGSSGTASDPPAESCSSSLPQTPLLGSRSGAGGGRDGWGWISEIPLMPMLGFSHCVSCSEHALLWNCRAGSRAVPTRSPPRELAARHHARHARTQFRSPARRRYGCVPRLAGAAPAIKRHRRAHDSRVRRYCAAISANIHTVRTLRTRDTTW